MDWQVVTNTLSKDTNHVDGRKSWQFPPSPVFSTYVFALHAGPYAFWKANANGIPIRLFARKSLAKYVDHQEWLKITQQGLMFYGTQFGYPYPFAKYDQIIVPDFNEGAMENVGAVTFSERYIFRTKVTQDKHMRRADTILHEMAHMWFGDLVTMRWWNGLWLNESFATFMSSWAIDQATQFTGIWQTFFTDIKTWAYREDQLVTTHPIELPVPDTDHAEANFDGITYGKGASTLKQLSFYLSEDDFREGLQRYFQKYAFKNTTLTDFIQMLSEASSQDLSKWQHSWLQTTGVNTIQTAWA
jgi:aminopeptidase N